MKTSPLSDSKLTQINKQKKKTKNNILYTKTPHTTKSPCSVTAPATPCLNTSTSTWANRVTLAPQWTTTTLPPTTAECPTADTAQP